MSHFKAQLLGNLGSDATSRETSAGTVIQFSIAHSEGKDKPVTWVRCTYWPKNGNTAILQYLRKGTPVFVEGTPKLNTYDKDGETKASLEMTVYAVQLAGKATDSQPAESRATAPQNKPQGKPAPEPIDDDDLPF